MIAGGTLIVMTFAGSMATGVTTTLRGLIEQSCSIRVDGRGCIHTINQIGLQIIAMVAIPLLVLALAAIGGNLIQHRLVWSLESLKPKLAKSRRRPAACSPSSRW